jgi:hypothetical protein
MHGFLIACIYSADLMLWLWHAMQGIWMFVTSFYKSGLIFIFCFKSKYIYIYINYDIVGFLGNCVERIKSRAHSGG